MGIVPQDGKACTECGVWKPLTEYYTKRSRGKETIRAHCKTCDKAKNATWAAANRERSRTIKKKYQDAHPEVSRKKAKRWRERHPLQKRIVAANARAHGKYGIDGSITVEEWVALCEQYNNRCLRCGATDRQLVPDHIVSLGSGGANHISNIQPLCYECNRTKSIHATDYRRIDEAVL